MADNKGRRKGSRNRGYFFRSGRGWFTKEEGGNFHPLTNEAGERLRDENTPKAEIEKARARFLVAPKPAPASTAPDGVITVLDVCRFYIAKTGEVEKTRQSTIDERADTLFDLCHGLPAKYRKKGPEERKSAQAAKERIHKGYGNKPACELTRADLLEWCGAHKGWGDGGRRTYLQAIRRAMNFAVDWNLIPKEHNRINGIKIPKARERATYISPEQEKALLAHCCPALKMAIGVLIRTGMRPGCEFAKITAAHVTDRGQRMEIRFRFAAGETKTDKPRVVRVKDAELMKIIRQQIAKYPTGPIFRNVKGRAWLGRSLRQGFGRALKRAQKEMEFDPDCCLYSCRHTFARRTLTGYWTGTPINMDILAVLMGNTPEVCRRHYADLAKEIGGMEECIWSAI